MQKIRATWFCDWCGEREETDDELVPKFPPPDEDEDDDFEDSNDVVEAWVNVGCYEVDSGECIRFYDICQRCSLAFDEWRSKLQSNNGLPVK